MVRIHPCPFSHAEVAQLGEQHLDMVEVVGSSPIARTQFFVLAERSKDIFLPLHIINLQSAGRCDMVHVL